MPNEHALLSASSSERWLHCTAAPRLEETLTDKGSSFAAEGTLAHAVAELKALKKFTLLPQKAYTSELKKLKADPLWQAEMDAHTDTYASFLTEKAQEFKERPFVALEVRVDYSTVAPSGFGTADCIMIGGGTVHVIDFKYGKGVPVSAEDNPQMKLYALGALNAYAVFYGDSITRIRVSVIQPRLDSVSTWEISREALKLWAEQTVKPAAEAAFNGTGVFCEGEWCRFCRAKATCKARANTNTALEDFAFALSPTLTDAEIGGILFRAQRLKAWVSDLEDYALEAVLAGKEIPGWKAVEGRSNRAYTNQDAVKEILTASGYPDAIIFKPKELYGITEMEKLVGKKNFGTLLEGCIFKPAGKPTLATADDKRPAYSSAASDFAGVTQQ